MDCPACGARNEVTAEVCFSCRAVLLALTRGTLLAGRYEIREVLGRGGMGAVYRAHDRVLDEEVALKVLRPDVALAPGMADRFLGEIKLARRVSHPNVCRIHEYGQEGTLRFISMERVDGPSLKELLAAGPLPPDRAFDVAEQAARGLAAIHAVGIVHRDLKPANLTLDGSGRVRVMDFGIAKDAGQGGDTAAGYLLGSPEYMSPEQARGRGADARSDLYALGIVTFELFSGHPPFRADTPVATLLQHIEAEPPLEAGDPPLPAPLRPVLRRALAKDPRERHASAAELADALRAARAGRAPGAGSVASRPRRAWRTAAMAAGLLAVLAVAWGLRPAGSGPSPQRSDLGVSPPATAVPEADDAPTPPPDPAPSPVRAALRPRPSVAPRAEATPSPLAAPEASAPPLEPPAPAGSASSEADMATEGQLTTAAPGFLLVVVSPWADVIIDGQPAGQTPLQRIRLDPGPHSVRLSHPAYRDYLRKVTVRTGETTRLRVDLAQDGVRAVP
jgi:serine/threonine-protein kinase